MRKTARNTADIIKMRLLLDGYSGISCWGAGAGDDEDEECDMVKEIVLDQRITTRNLQVCRLLPISKNFAKEVYSSRYLYYQHISCHQTCKLRARRSALESFFILPGPEIYCSAYWSQKCLQSARVNTPFIYKILCVHFRENDERQLCP